MATTQAILCDWLDAGRKEHATHMIVVCDTDDWEEYPVYVLVGEDPRALAAEYDGKTGQKLIEVYALHFDIDLQLSEHRAFHFESPSQG